MKNFVYLSLTFVNHYTDYDTIINISNFILLLWLGLGEMIVKICLLEAVLDW